MNKLYTTKGGGSLTNVDAKAGLIEGYAADFDSLDSDGDVFQKGAFKKSITENKSRIMHLLQHDVHKPLGRPSTLIEDSKGLRFGIQITKGLLEVGYIRDAVKLYEEGVYNEHSVGFITLKDHREQRNQKDVNIITEVKLMEYSTVTWGANENTPLIGMKSLTKDNILDKFDRISKGLRVGGLTDETYINLEIELQQIKAHVAALLPSTDTKEEGNTPLEDVALFYKAILNK